MGDVDEALGGSRGARWQDLRWVKPVRTWREPHRGGGPEFQAAGVGDRGNFLRTRQHRPDGDPARDAGGDNSGQAWCEGRSHQRRRCESFSVLSLPRGC